MDLKHIFAFFNPRARRAEEQRRNDEARDTLRANAEKALRLKRQSEPATRTPEHRTAHEGMRDTSTEVEVERNTEAGFTPQMKRSRIARSGDAS